MKSSKLNNDEQEKILNLYKDYAELIKEEKTLFKTRERSQDINIKTNDLKITNSTCKSKIG